jgi:hypothetical protein
VLGEDVTRAAPPSPKSTTQVPACNMDHIVFSEADSIPHSTYKPSPNRPRAKDSCGPLINDIEHVKPPVTRPERKQHPVAPCANMGGILNPDLVQVQKPQKGRIVLGGQQTFTFA